MKIEFQRTGGFAGPATNKRFELDSESLPMEAQDELSRLIASAGQTEAKGAQSLNLQLRDPQNYRVKIDAGERQLTFAGRMADLPEQVRGPGQLAR